MSFKDVGNKDWYYGFVQVASQNGLIRGYEDGSLQPESLITREGMAVMISRAIRFADSPKQLTDKSILEQFGDRSEAIDALGECTSLGIINRDSKGRFAPKRETTRTESVVLLTHMLRYLNFIN